MGFKLLKMHLSQEPNGTYWCYFPDFDVQGSGTTIQEAMTNALKAFREGHWEWMQRWFNSESEA